MGVSATTESVGQQIKRLRERKSISGCALAKMAGVSQPFIWQIENGEAEPSISSLEKIATALGVSVRALFPATQNQP